MSTRGGAVADEERQGIKQAFEALAGKHEAAERLFAYYDGTAGVPLISERLRDVYQDQLADLSENWAAVVIDSAADRITLERLEGPDDAATRTLADIVADTDLLIEADDAHQQALIGGESFIIAWRGKDEAGADEPIEAYTQHPDSCAAFYDPARPNVMTSAAKWHDADGNRVVTIYRPDVIQVWTAARDKLTSDDEAARGWKAFTLADEADNPYGVVPVFHYRPARRQSRSDLCNILPLQDAVNILVTNMLVAAEFGAFPLKYVMTDANLPKRLKASPNRIWELPEGSTPGQFDAADLSHFIAAIDHLVNSIAIISRTPRHYFYGSQDAPSGEALRVMEAPLVKKCGDRIARFTPTWRQLAAFLYRLQTGDVRAPREFRAVFADPATVQPLHEAQTRKTTAEAIDIEAGFGLSKKRALMELGHSEAEATKILAERGTEQTSVGNELLRQFDAGAGAVGA